MALAHRLTEALEFTAPYVVERLVSDRVAGTPEEAVRLFAEAKRYLVLCEASPDRAYGMYSSLVDSAWHTFVLFTAEYTDYGHRYFGKYLHHAPATDTPDDMAPDAATPDLASFDEFRQRYEDLFGEALPAIWYDDAVVAPGRRVVNDSAGSLVLNLVGDAVELSDAGGDAVLSVSAVASDALDFLARTPDFYVREVPGLTDDERVGLIQSLVRCGLLRLAP